MEGEVNILRGGVHFLLFFSCSVHACASDMKDADIGEEEDFFVKLFHSNAKISIFIVEKKPFIESVDLEKELSRNGEGGAAYPCGPSDCFRFPDRGASRKSSMISKKIGESNVCAGAPWLRHFRFEKELETDNAD